MNRIGESMRRTALACALLMSAATPTLIADGPAPTRAQSQYESRFMTAMIDHHAMAVEMAEACLANAVHEELRTMCSDIIAAQTQEIATMQSWPQQWYGVTYATARR